MHVMVHPNRLINISILPLRFEDEVVCELGVAPQGPYAFHNVPMIKLRGFTLCRYDASFESRAPR